MGITPFLIVSIDSVMIIAMNAVLQRYGGAGQGDLLITGPTRTNVMDLAVLLVDRP